MALFADSLRCEGSDAIGAKRTCRERRERVDLTKMTHLGRSMCIAAVETNVAFAEVEEQSSEHSHVAAAWILNGREGPLSRLMSLMFAACLLAIGTSTSVPAADPNWPKSLTLGTASPGGVYYVYGDALAPILTEKLGIPVNPQPTQGPVHNVQLVESGVAQLGLITMGVGLQGWNGTGAWTKGKQFRNLRALFPMYDTPFQAVVLGQSGITTLAQLDKKRIGVGPKAGTGGTYIPEIIKVLGISGEMNYGSLADMATELLDRHLDAVCSSTSGATIGNDKSLSRLRLSCVAPRLTDKKRCRIRSREYLTKRMSALVLSGIKPTTLSGKHASILRMAVLAVLAPAIVMQSVSGGHILLCCSPNSL
jgi:TRAP transporter TAXI family solute receptor